MQINWFTVGAQLVNFLVLVWLMKRYLYKPILDAVDTREKKIKADLNDAKNNMVAAKKEQDEFKKKNDDFDDQKKKMMDKATANVAKDRKKLLDEAKKDAESVKQKMVDAAKELQESTNKQLAQQAQNQVVAIAKNALKELASTTLEEQSIQVFIGKIKSLTGKDKTKFVDAFHSKSNPISITSAFELAEKQKQKIKTAVADLLGEDGNYEFKISPKTISGLELATNGYKLSWNFSAYISSLEKSMAPVNN